MRDRHGIDALTPDEPGRTLVHRVIYDELCLGVVREESRAAYDRAIGLAGLVGIAHGGIVCTLLDVNRRFNLAESTAQDLRFGTRHKDKPVTIETPDGERAKTAEVAASCWGRLGRAGFTRSDAIVGLGGGATTDLAGLRLAAPVVLVGMTGGFPEAE